MQNRTSADVENTLCMSKLIKKKEAKNEQGNNIGKHFCGQLKQSLAQLMIHAPVCSCRSCSHEKAIIRAHRD